MNGWVVASCLHFVWVGVYSNEGNGLSRALPVGLVVEETERKKGVHGEGAVSWRKMMETDEV